MTRARMALSYAWHVPPASLRDVTLDELAAMVDFLAELHGGAPS